MKIQIPKIIVMTIIRYVFLFLLYFRTFPTFRTFGLKITTLSNQTFLPILWLYHSPHQRAGISP